MPRQGNSFHRLVHAIERSVVNNPSVRIEAPKMMPNKDTGRLREHDIVLTFTEGHRELLMAIECRDRSKPVGVPDVEQFHSKRERTGIDRGIIVSQTGFTKTAIEKAASYNIGCLSLGEVERFDWCRAPGVDVLTCELAHADVTLMFPGVGAQDIPIELEDGTPTTEQTFRTCAMRLFETYLRANATEGELAKTFVEDNPPVYTKLQNGERVRAGRIQIAARYRITHTFVPLDFHRYFDMAKGTLVADTVVAAVPLGDGQMGEMILSRGASDGPLRVGVVPRPEKLRKQ